MAFDPDAPRNWDPKSQEMAARLAKGLGTGEFKGWFCRRGRTCDGIAHPGMEYPHARADQWPPPGSNWSTWMLMSGRGSGKTRTSAEWIRKMSERASRMAMIGRRGPDIRETMVEGESGLIAVCERAGVGYLWEPSKKTFTFANGAKVSGYSAEEPDTLRGPQHSVAWLDEPAHMPLIEQVWDNLLMGLRIPTTIPGGSKVLCSTTPIASKWIKERAKDPTTKVVRVSTYANIANLDPAFKKLVLDKYEGTRKGRQELHGEILDDVVGAMWMSAMFDGNRYDTIPDMDRIVIGVDPAGSRKKKANETGIVVYGRSGNEQYLLGDYSGKYSPSQWAAKIEWAFKKHAADRVVVERNYGAEMVEAVFDNTSISLPITYVQSVRGKKLRAEPIAALYEKNRVHHPRTFSAMDFLTGESDESLEDQMCQWIPGVGDSPDRVDAAVHALTELAGLSGESGLAAPSR